MIAKIITISLLALVLLGGCGKKEEATSAQASSSSEEAQTPSNVINLKTTTGDTIKLTALENGIEFENYKGKIVLVDFFATWCPPCLAEIPHLNDIQNSFKNDVQIIGVLMEESKDNQTIEKFRTDNKMAFPVTNSADNFALSDALGGIRSLPTMVMYDKNGEYFTHYVGAAPQEMIESDIRKAMAQ